MATEEGVHSAQEICNAFVNQYFIILGNRPEDARKLYVDASVVSRPGPDGTMMSFNSVEAINEQILSCDYKNTTFEVLSIDSQYSLEDGLFIMVIGFLIGKDNLRRKFSQMFYLALQNTYVVLNDIFRYVDEDDSTPKTLPVLEPVQSNEKNAAEVKNVVAEATTPVDNGKIKHSDEKAVTAPKPTEPVAETVAPQLDGAKKSFAAIVQSMAKSAAPFQAKAPVQKPKYMGQPRAAAAPQKSASVSNSVKKIDQKIIEEPGTSIFVANLPLNAMPPQLHELFNDFGPIKENGIQVRISRGQSNIVCFGFIAFESTTSVQSVLQAAKNTPFMLADRKLRVKEKEVDYDGSKQSSGKTRGGSGGSKTQNGSADGGDEFKPVRNRRNGSANGGDEFKPVRNRRNGSADGGDEFKPVRNRRNGSADGGDELTLVRNRRNESADGEDEFKPVRNRRNGGKNERRGARNANGDNNQKNSEGGAPQVQKTA